MIRNQENQNKNGIKITIQRRLEPQPPKDAKPEWCEVGKLIFYDQRKNTVWKQDVREAMILNEKGNHIIDFKADYLEGLGWHVRATLSDEDANFLHPIMLNKLTDKYQT